MRGFIIVAWFSACGKQKKKTGNGNGNGNGKIGKIGLGIESNSRV
jgi:hypothetical protein